MTCPSPEPRVQTSWLADSELRAALERFVRRRLPDDQARDVVQATVADLLAIPELPADREGCRRFAFAVARHKLIDHLRLNHRELPAEHLEHLQTSQEDPLSARDLLRWVQEELSHSDDLRTLQWMLREAEGDKLEHIAEEVELPAPRVRQRVWRLRRLLRERWVAQLAAASIACALVGLGYAWWRQLQPAPLPITRESPSLPEQADALRQVALQQCSQQQFVACLQGLDRARALHPAGEATESVRTARAAAERALHPLPAPAPTLAPTATATSVPRAVPSTPPTSAPKFISPIRQGGGSL
jgi:DNA-directed RNA polymerase specialized sigma24 family protein